jgi:hypothetical protein
MTCCHTNWNYPRKPDYSGYAHYKSANDSNGVHYRVKFYTVDIRNEPMTKTHQGILFELVSYEDYLGMHNYVKNKYG